MKCYLVPKSCSLNSVDSTQNPVSSLFLIHFLNQLNPNISIPPLHFLKLYFFPTLTALLLSSYGLQIHCI